MLLVCWVSWEGETMIVHARGEIDQFTSASLGWYVQTAMKESHTRMVLDLSEVTFIDATGLRALKRCHQDCREQGLPFGVTRPAPHIRRLLELESDRVVPVIHLTPEKPDEAPAPGRMT